MERLRVLHERVELSPLQWQRQHPLNGDEYFDLGLGATHAGITRLAASDVF